MPVIYWLPLDARPPPWDAAASKGETVTHRADAAPAGEATDVGGERVPLIPMILLVSNELKSLGLGGWTAVRWRRKRAA